MFKWCESGSSWKQHITICSSLVNYPQLPFIAYLHCGIFLPNSTITTRIYS
nr:MAG TPA: hypothetical protein [Caudoviricetes sp.]DAY63516.1 MAG TPA: hypothetical protein [Caudoviricetes sp.]